MELALILLAVRLVVGVVSAALMLYVTYGFRHAVSWRTIKSTMTQPGRATPSDLMAIALAMFHVKGFVRLAWWDVGAILLGVWGVLPFGAAIYVSAVNIGLGVAAGLACLVTMYAQYRMIPAAERHAYSMWSAPRYPWANARKRSSLSRATSPEGDAMADLRHELVNAQTKLRALAREHLAGSELADDMANEALRR